MVEELQINQFYTAPTAIRLLMKEDDGHVDKYDLSRCPSQTPSLPLTPTKAGDFELILCVWCCGAV
jgi:hypothetical protein